MPKYYRLNVGGLRKDYIHEIHGMEYVSWVDQKDKVYALAIPDRLVKGALAVVQHFTDRPINIEEIK